LIRRIGTPSTWIAALVSLFLVFVLPACVAAAMTQARAGLGQGATNSNNSNEEREEREHAEESTAARSAAPPKPEAPSRTVVAPPIAVRRGDKVFASVAPKPHPSLFSERRLR
jgi:hypothetical protein